MPQQVTFRRHQLWAEVLLGREHVVSTAVQSEVGSHVRTPFGERLQVMKLQIACFRAALAPFIEIGAAPAVSLKHCTPFRRRDVSSALTWWIGHQLLFDHRIDALARFFDRFGPVEGDALARWFGLHTLFESAARVRFGWRELFDHAALATLARCFFRFARFARFEPGGYRLAFSSPVGHPESLLLERRNEHLHCFEVELAEGRLGSRARQERLGAFDEMGVLFDGGELHLVVLRARDRWQVGGRGPHRQRITLRRARIVTCSQRFVVCRRRLAGVLVAHPVVCPVARPFANRQFAHGPA